MQKRESVLVRRTELSATENKFYIILKSQNHVQYPEDKKNFIRTNFFIQGFLVEDD